MLAASIACAGEAAIAANLIHPHQRCGYSDSPFARKDTFLYCRVQKCVVGGGW